MSKFFKALEQTRRDRGLSRGDQTTPFHTPEIPAPVATAPGRPVEPTVVDEEEARPRRGGMPTESDAGDERPRPQPRLPAADTEEGLDEHLVSLVAPAALQAEQYRALRHIVEQMQRTTELKVIAVSSPGMGDGKTITAVNLAGALAQSSDARVLLIDADLRRPALGRLLHMSAPRNADLASAILDPRLTLEHILQERPPFNLSVICAGQTPPSPYELLQSPRFGELIEEARRQYDFVIIDTPPLAPVQDCRVIGRWVDGFLLVVAAHRTPRRLLEDSLAVLDRAKILGIVFNRDDRSVADRYRGYYGESYALAPPAPGPGPGAAFGRAVRQIGDSLRGRRRSSDSSRRRPGEFSR
jgi:capsular exopolysaccharide synthesis family protein